MAITDNLPKADDARDQIRELRAQVEHLMADRVTPALSSAAGYADDYSKKARAMTADGADLGGRHLALEVSDLAAVARRLEAAGATLCGAPETIAGGPWDGLQWVFALTPFGLQVELMQFPPEGCGYERRTARRLHHPTTG